ncbi:MAG: BNR repeat-containing glycosyl hydrolase [uncultured bacterium (gcode 4)]|uniref:BNR repeat-containing glycosyl hydrolase n=1 Tax=uncultured bacterium (gcode 4) TaxID=1234023 RepID=K2AV91_9BACT|nr:MAG: BNR repeat-containing glycosyl hydrolase [uncultured bacterium (gcode 4)]
MKIIKKFFVYIIVISLVFNQSFYNIVNASASLSIQLFLLNWVSSNLSVNPGDSFKISLEWINDGTDTLTSVYWNVYFSDNNSFTYNTNLFTLINFATITNPIPGTDYTAWNWLYTQITGWSTTTLIAWKKPKISWTALNNFTANSNISTYSNTIYWKFSGLDPALNPINSTISQLTIYANVRPHITDYYFEKADGSEVTNQIQWANAEAINLVLKVKDYNGCANIDGWAVVANLSQIWLSSSESLTYNSCDGDGKTAIFKRTWITTTASLSTYNFNYSHFTATDEDGNVNTPTDANTTFDDEDKKTDFPLTVISAGAPGVSNLWITDDYIGWPAETSTTFSFSGSQDGEYKVALWSDWTCNWWTTLLDWTATWTYVAWDSASFVINSASLSDWNNNIYACFRNVTSEIWSTTQTIIKDTTNPTISSLQVSPASVVTNDSNVSFICSEAGYYKTSIGWNIITNYTITTAGATNSSVIPNANLFEWDNIITVYCKDDASNELTTTTNVVKSTAPPSLNWAVTSFSDTDIDYDWLNWSDLNFTWDNTNAVSYNYFESYRLYLLPSNITLNTSSHTYIKILSDKNLATWTWDSTITKDSTNTDLVNWASYQMCIAIMWTNWQLWEAGCSDASALITDVVQHPNVLSARFNSSTNLELTTDATLDTDIATHSGELVSFIVWSTTYTGTAIASVDSQKINITIPDLWNLWATWTGLLLFTWAIHSFSWGFNNYFSSGSLIITDWQAPTIAGFVNNTASPYGSFFSWSINVWFTFAEAMRASGYTKITFDRTAWNASAQKIYEITDSSKLTPGVHSVDINLVSLWLVSGTTYDMKITGQDLAGNSVTSGAITVKFDNVWPVIMSLSPIWISWITDPFFNWLATTDDGGNWSGVGGYTLKIFSGSTCTTLLSQTGITDPITLQYQVLLADMRDYAWNIVAYDNMSNLWTTSACDSFSVNTSIPVISSLSIKNNWGTPITYTKTADTIKITANVVNSNTDNISINLSSLTGNWSHTNVVCSAPGAGISCTYVGWVVTYTFAVWFAGAVTNWLKWTTLTTNNTDGINTQNSSISVTVDNTAPAIVGTPITAPISSSVWWWTTQTIVRTAGSITDNYSIAYMKLEYSNDNWWSWNDIATGSNLGSYNWDISALASDTDYKIKLTAFDRVDNNTSTISDAFTIDKVAPAVAADTITTPNGSNIYKWWQALNIAWDQTKITDNIALASSPIKLEYTLDNWTAWTQIATGEANDGTYAWTVPSVNSSQVKIRLTATDNATNINLDTSDTTFIIDSTLPTVALTFAGAGWSTPQNGKYINNSWLDITATTSDSYLDRVMYKLENITDTQYWQQSTTGWLGIENWNDLCIEPQALWNGWTCANIAEIATLAGILGNKDYRLTIKAIDEAWNEKTYNPVDYIGDVVSPNLSITTANNYYFSGSINIAGTASDALSGLSSTNIEIKKWALWWNGSDWVVPQTVLVTSGTAGNWNYNFTSPGADADATNYNVIITTHDSAFKTNNNTSSNINIIKDSSGPIIDNSVFTFDTSGIRKWWTAMTITWNPALITTIWASLNANSIKLDYNFTGSIIPIASWEANDGSYNFTLPAGVDSLTAKFIITAYDNLWNISNVVASSDFIIDSLPPTVSTVETQDFNTDGQIDWFIVTFSEKINNWSVNVAEFSVSDWITLNNWSHSIYDAGNYTKLELYFNAQYWDTSSIPTLSYNWVAIEDIASNKLANFTNKASVDKASPRITNAEIYDTNSNGKVDQIKVYFTENITSTTDIWSFTLNNVLPGASISGASVSGNVWTLSLVESSNYNTSPDGMTITFSNNGAWKDISPALNVAGNRANIALIDKASPVKISAITTDSNSNSKIDRLDITFSEDIVWNIDWDITVWNLAAGSSKWASSVVSNVLRIAINETSDNNDTAQIPTFAYNWANLKDSSNNLVANIASFSLSDWVKPKLLLRETVDSNWNGKLDKIKITFSETLNNNVWAIVINVAWYVVSSYSSSANLLYANLDELDISDTWATPNVQITSNTTLWDTTNNLVFTEWAATASTDKVWPVVIWARYSANTVYVDLSENYGGVLDNNSFVLSGSALPSITNTVWAGSQVTITLSWPISANTEISAAANTVEDGAWNKQASTYFMVISSSLIINEVMYSTGNTQYIELKNLWANPVDLTNWVIENGGGNWVNITVTAWNIPAWWLFLITKTGITELNWVVTDFNAGLSLDLTTQNDLILKDNSWNIWDSVQSSPWPAGSGSLWVAMERISSPGNWLNSSSWYSATTNNWLTAWFLGTPKNPNVFDSTIPTINSFSPADNTLYPVGWLNVVYNYSDNVAVDDSSYTFALEKWNGVNAWNDASAGIANSSVSVTSATFTLANLTFWKYKASFTIDDTSGNTVSKDIIFYVDKFEFTISNSSINLWVMEVDSLVSATQNATITIKTLGAGFDLNIGWDTTLDAWINSIQSWNTLYWFWIDYEATNSATPKVFWTTDAIPKVLESNPTWSIDWNWNQKTFTYNVKYQWKIPFIQVAGNYSANTSYTVDINY